MARYIDADALDFSPLKNDFDKARAKIIVLNQPTAEVAEIKHAHWIKNERNIDKMKEFHKKGIAISMSENSIFWTCSACDMWGTPHSKYCGECGAIMDGKDV